MAKKLRIKTIEVSITPTKFTSLFNRLRGDKSEYEFSEIADLRKILSKEKARMLYTLKYEKPSSLYQLAKLLKRDFKSVRQDVLVLEKFGFVEFEKNLQGHRKSLKPLLVIDSLHVNFDI